MNQEFMEWEKQLQRARDVLENPESYDLEHQGNNGNKGLANFLAYAAVTEKDGELTVLDEYEELFEKSGREKRYMNITDRLVENEVDGRERLEEMIASAEMEQLSQLDNEYNDKGKGDNQTLPDSKPKPDTPKGGEASMTDEEHSNARRTLAGAVSRHKNATGEMIHHAARAERNADSTLEAAVEVIEEYRQTGIYDSRSVQSYLNRNVDNGMAAVHAALGDIEDDLDDFESTFDGYGTDPDGGDMLDGATGYNGRPDDVN